MKIIPILILTLVLTSVVNALTLTIPSYPQGSTIPDDYTFSSGGQCSGDNVSPQLTWSDIPSGTMSFAVVFDDAGFNHWKLINIDPSITHIPENNPNDVGTDGITSFGFRGYGGPCPPNNPPHTYVMTIYALNTVFATDNPSVANIISSSIESASWTAFRSPTDAQDRIEYKATYDLTFHAEWSATSHPVDFPAGAHFSQLIGNSHNANGFIWQNMQLATTGVKNIAETGSTTALNSEVFTSINTSGSEALILGSGSGSSATAITNIEFDVSESHPLFSMVSMIAPSPDWFIGVHGLDLRDNNGLWKNTFSVDLLPYDSGTDSGTSFTSSNIMTNPVDNIGRILTAPFANNAPLGRFEFTLIDTAGVVTLVDDVFSNGFE